MQRGTRARTPHVARPERFIAQTAEVIPESPERQIVCHSGAQS
jgi:hypothetical protein